MENKSSAMWDNTLILIVFIICFGFIYMATFYHIPKSETMANRGVDLAASVILILVGYRWGSSRGSSKKDETIGNLLNPTETSTVHTDISKTVETKPEVK